MGLAQYGREPNMYLSPLRLRARESLCIIPGNKMYTRIRLLTNKTFSTTTVVARLVSSRASTDTSSLSHGNHLKEILRKNGPRHSVPSLLQQRVDLGHPVTLPELRSISNRLIRSNRHDLALQMMEWMEKTQKDVHFSTNDTCLRLELIIKSHGLKEAEEYFEQLSVKLARAAYLPLLRAYVKNKLVHEAEAFMEKLNGLGFLVTPHPFNEMMKLYEATRQYEKVVLVISLMKRNKIPRNVLSYNLWMNACSESVAGVESVYKEMVDDDKSVEVGWSSLCTLANVYVKAGFVDKASLVLESAEKKLNRSNRLGYFFLITLYASLGNKEGVVRLWRGSKSVSGRATCTNYICVLSSLVKLGDLAEAERVFGEWEENTCGSYDVRVSNVLLGAYTRDGDIHKAEALHHRVLERGGEPNYKTWEILMEGWVKCQSMEKAVDAMHRAFELMKGCHWRPSQNIVMAIAEYFEKEGEIDEANGYVRDLHRLGLASLPLYRLLLRMHEHVHRPAYHIHEMMKLDKTH